MSINSNNEKAFTLVELLLSVSILSIIYSYSFSNLNKLHTKLNQRFYLLKIKNFVELAQSKSFHKENINILVYENEIRMLANSTLKHILKIPRKYKISLPNTKNNIIRFYLSGIQSPFSIDLISMFYRCSLTTSLRGRIKSVCSKI